MENAQNAKANETPFVMADYIDRPSFANQLGIKKRTLELWAHQRKGPRPILIGGRSFYHVDDVQEWLDAQRKAAMQNEPRSRRVAG